MPGLSFALTSVFAVYLIEWVRSARGTDEREALADSERRHRAILRAIPDLIFILDRDGTFVDFHAGDLIELYAPPEQFLGKNVRETLPAELAADTLRAIDQAYALHQPAYFEYSLPIRGETRFYEGRIVELDAAQVLSIVRDVTDRRRTEEALEESRRFTRRVTEAMPNVLFVYDVEEQRNIYVNDRSEAVLGYTAEEVLAMGERFLETVMHPDDFQRLREARQHYDKIRDDQVLEQVFRLKHKNGHWLWVQRSMTVFTRSADGLPKQVVGTATDITALKRAEQQLQSLSSRLLEVQENEQRRIARELHDGTAQMLFAIGANMATLRQLPGLPSNAADLLSESQTLVEECLKEVRSLSYLLHNPLIEEVGLPAALKWLVEGIRRRSNLEVDLDIGTGLDRLPPALARDLFRIVQEALGNVVRHSGSQRAMVRLERGEDQVRLLIQDFGRGMLPAAGLKPEVPGIGLPGMRERLRYAGGRLDITSSDQGTTLEATVPIGGAEIGEALLPQLVPTLAPDAAGSDRASRGSRHSQATGPEEPT